MSESLASAQGANAKLSSKSSADPEEVRRACSPRRAFHTRSAAHRQEYGPDPLGLWSGKGVAGAVEDHEAGSADRHTGAGEQRNQSRRIRREGPSLRANKKSFPCGALPMQH